MEPSPSWREQKQAIRRQAEANRSDQPDQETVSQRICQRLVSLPEYEAAQTVMCYVGVRSEVRTQSILAATLAQGKRLVVPYCVGDTLGLFRLLDMGELDVATFGIPEPKPEYRMLSDRTVGASELDLIVVPGVAFDRRGGRVGHGKGYYDRLLANVRPDTPLVALAFDCQLFPEIPMQPHDVFMDKVVTESAAYLGAGQGRGERSDAVE